MNSLPSSPLHLPGALPALPTEAVCPLCGQANQCAVAQKAQTPDCWCMHTSLAPNALARVPASAQGRHCICPACARPQKRLDEGSSDNAGSTL